MPPVETPEELESVFFDTDEHALQLTLSEPDGANPRQVPGIFEVPHEALDVDGLVEASDRRPTVVCAAHLVADVRNGWRVEVPGEPPRKVVDLQPSGDGLMTLVLHRL